MDLERFHDTTVSLLLSALNLDKADKFEETFEQAVSILAGELHAVDDAIRAQARPQVIKLRRLAGLQLDFLERERLKALAHELDLLGEESFVRV